MISFEKSIHTFFEPNLQAVFIDHRWIIDFANFMYMNSHFVVTTAFLVWLYLFRNQNFYFVRNMFMVAMGLAVVGYALLPTAPPRMFDRVHRYDHAVRPGQSRLRPGEALHQSLRGDPQHARGLLDDDRGDRRTDLAGTRSPNPLGAYPVLVFWVVVVTANHFWVDGAFGLLVAALSALTAAQVLARVRPAVWSWRPATA